VATTPWLVNRSSQRVPGMKGVGGPPSGSSRTTASLVRPQAKTEPGQKWLKGVSQSTSVASRRGDSPHGPVLQTSTLSAEAPMGRVRK
jgi:hypothetical protein